MGSHLETAVSQLKMGIAAQKAQSLSNVAHAKARLLSTQRVADIARVAGANAAAFTSDIATPTVKEEVRREGNVIYYSDGSMGYIGNNERITPIVDNKQLENVRAQEDARQIDEITGVVPGSFQDTAGTFLGTTTDIAAGAAKLVGTGEQTLTGAIKSHNNMVNGPPRETYRLAGAVERGGEQTVSTEGAARFRKILAKIGTNEEFSSEDWEFMDTPEYALIQDLQDNVDIERGKAKSIDEFKDKFNNAVAPSARGDDVAYAIGKANAEAAGGTMEAIAYQFDNIDHMVKSGIASIPYTIANTIGGPVVQMAILAAFSRKKAGELTEDFIRENGREPSESELTRLNLAGFLSATSEKFGDVLLIKGFNLGRFSKSVKAIADSTPSSMKRFIAKPLMGLAGEGSSGMLTEVADQYGVYGEVRSGSEVVQAGVEEAVGAIGGVGGIGLGNLAASAVKGTVNAATAASRAERLREDLARPQTVADTPESRPIQGRIDEIGTVIEGNALSTEGGTEAELPNVVALAAERAQLQGQLDAPAEGALSPKDRARAQSKYDNLPDRVKPEAQTVTARDLSNTVTVDNSAIGDTEFTATIASISDEAAPLQTRLEKFLTLQNRDMNDVQRVQYEEQRTALQKASEEFAEAPTTEPKTLSKKKGSHGIIDTDDTYDRDKLEEVSTDPGSSEADVAHTTALIGAQDTRAKLAGRNRGSMAAVAIDVAEGTDSRWTGFKTYLDTINEAATSLTVAATGTAKSKAAKIVQAAIGQMVIHRDNMAKKSSALSAALATAADTGTPQYVRGKTGEGYQSETNRVMEYTDPIEDQEAALGRSLTSTELATAQIELEAAYNNRKESGAYIYRVDNTPESQSLVGIVADEAAYGDYMVTAAETHNQTSYARDAAATVVNDARLQKQIQELDDTVPAETVQVASNEDIDALDNLDTTESSPNETTNEASSDTTSRTNNSRNTTSERDSARETPPPADGPETDAIASEVETTTTEPTVEEAEVSVEAEQDTQRGTTTPDTEASSEAELSPTVETEVTEEVSAGPVGRRSTEQSPVITISDQVPAITGTDNFLNEEHGSTILTANNRAGSDLEGKTASELLKVTKSRKGIFNIPTEMFSDPSILASALVSLGISEDAATSIVTQYENYNQAYQQLRVSNPELQYGIPILGQPLWMLQRFDESGVGTLPPQVILSLSIAIDHWAAQNLSHNSLPDQRAKALFMYGDMRATLAPIDYGNLNDIGLPHIEATQEIGLYAQKLLGISATETRTQPFIDALSSAMGALALEVINRYNTLAPENTSVARVDIINHRWQFLNKDANGNDIVESAADQEIVDGTDSRSFRHGTTHKHIRFTQEGSLDNRSLEDAQAAVVQTSETMDKLGNYQDQDTNNLPLIKPATDVISTIKGALGTVPQRMRDVIGELQKVSWTASDTLAPLAKLREANTELVHEMIGVEQYDVQYETTRRTESLDASNQDKIDALNDMIDAHEGGQLKKFFFKFRVMNQHRIMMQGHINPQNSHVTRYGVKPAGTTTYTKENIHLFKYAVMFAFGYNVDKEIPVNIAATFDQYMNDPDITDVAKMLGQPNPNMSAVADGIRVLRNKQEYADTLGNTDLSLFNGLVALSKYMPHHNAITKDPDSKYLFESDVVLEIDGVSNGFSINVMQFPVFENATILEKHLNQVAVYIGNTPETTTHLQSGIHDPNSAVSLALGSEPATDPYMDLKTTVESAITEDDAKFYYEEHTSWGADAISEFLETYTAKSKALAQSVPMLESVTRNLVKYPFMIFMYGGGVKSISEGVSRQVVDSLYETMGQLRKDAKTADNTEAKAQAAAAVDTFVTHLATLDIDESQRIKSILTGAGVTSDAAFKKFTFNENTIIRSVGELLAPRFGLGLNKMLGNTDSIRKAVVQSGEMLHAVFIQRYDIARKAYLKENDRAEDSWLSDKEIESIVRSKDVINWIPQFVGPMMNGNKNEFLDLSRRSSKRARNNTVQTVVAHLASTTSTTGTREVGTNTRQKDFIAPGVSALIRPIINFDAAMLAAALEKVPGVLMLYDAAMGRPEQLKEFAKVYNQAYLDYGLKHSIAEQMNERVIAIERMARDYDAEHGTNIMGQADTWLQKEGFVNRGVKEADRKSFHNMSQELGNAATETAKHRASLAQRFKEEGSGIDQMFAQRMEGTNPAAGTSVDERTNQIRASKDIMKGKVFEANEHIQALPREVSKLLKRLIQATNIDHVASQLRVYNPEHIATYVNIAMAHEGATKPGLVTKMVNRLEMIFPDEGSGRVLLATLVQDTNSTLRDTIGEDSYNKVVKIMRDAFDDYMQTDIVVEDLNIQRDAEVEAVMAEYLTPDQATNNSLENERRDAPKNVLNTGIDKTNVTKLFDKFKNMSRKYYNSDAEMNSHTTTLESVLESITKGLDHINGISLEVEQINGLTQGQYTEARKRVRVSLSRQLPGGRNEYSPQEVYMHEMLHALTVTALDDNSELKEQIHKVRSSVKTAIDEQGGYKVFLSGIPVGNQPTKREVDLAKKQYNYVFGPDARNVPAEFLAYALTNPAMIKALKAHSLSTPNRGTSVLGQLLAQLDKVIDHLIRAFTRKHKRNSHADMVAIADQLMSIQNAHESVADKAISKVISSSNEADKKVADFVGKKAVDLVSSTSTTGIRHYANAVIGAGVVQFGKNAAVQQATTAIHARMSGIAGSLVNEMGDGALTKPLVKMLLHAKGMIDKLYQQVELDAVRRMADAWKSVKNDEVGIKTRQAITRVLYRTDLSSLLSVGYSPNQIRSMIVNPANVKLAQDLLIKDSGLARSSDAIRYTRDLGYFIATQRGRLPQGHFNIHTIADKYLSTEDNTPDNRARLDAIASLEALNHQNSLDLKLVGDLMRTEHAADPNENAFQYMLESHRAYNVASQYELFNNNPRQMVKGYTSERVDNLTDMRTGLGDAATARKMAREGYIEVYQLGKINGVPGAHTTMYVSRYMPEIRHISGIMSTTGLHHKGTLISEIIAKDSKYQKADGTTDHRAIAKYIRQLHQREERDANNKVVHKDHNLRPLYDDQGNITDYRVIMNYESQEEIFSPEIEFQDVFAHMQSAYVSKKNTIVADKQTVDLLVDEWVRLEPIGRHKFINILDPNSKEHVRYKKLPDEVRQYLNQFVVKGEFLVREDILDKVFGYPAMDMSNISAIQGEMLGPLRSILRNVHYALRKFMTFGMERIVMATLKVILNNMVSNAIQLSIFQKIPPKYTARKMKEGYAAYARYEKDQTRLRDVHHDLQRTPAGAKRTSLEKELAALEELIEENPIHRMSALGLNTMLVEDINTASREGFMSRAHKMLQADKITRFTDKVPTTVTGLAKNMLLTRDSRIYKEHKRAVQLTDFLGRYVMIEHAVEVKGQDFDTVLHESIDAFVLFDENMHPLLEAINSMGFTAFLSYWLRVTRPVRRYITRSPVTVATAAGTQAITDIDTLAMMNASGFGGKFLPNIWYMDDLADAATNVYGVENAMTVVGVVEDIISGD